MRWLRLLAVAFIVSACETLTVPTTTTSDVLPPPDLISDPTRLSQPNPSSVGSAEAKARNNYLGSLPDGTGFVASLTGGDAEHVTDIRGGFVVEVGDRAIPVGEVSFREGGGMGSAYAGGIFRSTSGGWTVEIEFGDDALEFLGESAAEVVMGSIATVSRLGMPVLLLDDPFRWDRDQFPCMRLSLSAHRARSWP